MKSNFIVIRILVTSTEYFIRTSFFFLSYSKSTGLDLLKLHRYMPKKDCFVFVFWMNLMNFFLNSKKCKSHFLYHEPLFQVTFF